MKEVLINIGSNKEVLLGDFNEQDNKKIVGFFGEKAVNDNDLRFIHICETFNLRINNAFINTKKFIAIPGLKTNVI